MCQRIPHLVAALLAMTAVCYAQDTSQYIFGNSFTLTCSGNGVSGDWFLNNRDLHSHGTQYRGNATFESAGTYECRSSRSVHVTLGVIVLGQVGVVPTQETGNCSDSASTCPVRVVRGSNLQLCTELKSYPPSSIETVTVTDAIWFRGQSNRVVGCGGAAICRSFDSSYTYNGEWAACLNMTNISQSDTFTYRIYVNPSTDYPSNSPVSKTFAFAVSVEDATSSTPVPSSSIAMTTASQLPVSTTPTPSPSVPMTTPSNSTSSPTDPITGPNQDVIIAVVSTVLALLVICAVGAVVAGCVVLCQQRIRHTSSSLNMEEDGKIPVKTDSNEDQETNFLYMQISLQTEDGDNTTDGQLSGHESEVKKPHIIQHSPAVDSGFHSTESSLEGGDGIQNRMVGCRNENCSVPRSGGHGSPGNADYVRERPKTIGINMNFNHNGCDSGSPSMLEGELFRDGLGGKVCAC